MNAAAAVAAIVGASLASGCLAARPPDGAFACSAAGECPSGYYCATNHTCWANGHDAGALPSTIAQVGQATALAGNNLGNDPQVAMPSGVVPGDLLVIAGVCYQAYSTLDCADVTWTKVFDQIDDPGRLAACVKIAGAGEPMPSMHFGTEGGFALVAMAFAGVDAQNPVDTAMAVAGPTSPSLSAHAAAPLYVLMQGAIDWQVTVGPPAGATLATMVNNNASSEAAIATIAQPSPAGYVWRVPVGTMGVVAGTLALKPAR